MADYQRILLDPASQPAAQGDTVGAALRGQAISYAAAHPNQFDAILYEDPRYQWAVRSVSEHTVATLGANSTFVDSKITQLFGHAPHGDSEQVANSGRHVDNPIRSSSKINLTSKTGAASGRSPRRQPRESRETLETRTVSRCWRTRLRS
jgi:hypothetical protein